MEQVADCRLQYLGIWFVEDQWFVSAVDAVKSGMLEPRQEEPRDDFQAGPNGMAVVPVHGPITKGRGSFGGTSSLRLRKALRDLSRDSSVSGIMLHIDSPGGVAEGMFELAKEVRQAASQKPLMAHIEDMGASAAYWIATQAREISVNPTGEVGSIGTVAALVDSSERLSMMGLKVHVISTGPHKGAGIPGAKITDEQIAVFQERIDDLNAFFLEGVREGRNFTPSQLAAIATGRVWIGAKAQALGLVDKVQTWEDAIGSFAAELEGGDPVRRRSVRLQALELEAGAPRMQERPPTKVQTLIFSKEKFTREQARKWARDHEFRADKVDETENSFRLRQFDPSECRVGSFRTINMQDGVSGVICRRKE